MLEPHQSPTTHPAQKCNARVAIMHDAATLATSLDQLLHLSEPNVLGFGTIGELENRLQLLYQR